MMNVVKISVRNLVEYVFRSGSIESGFRTATSMTEGTRIHQKIQKTYHEGDHKEVYVQAEIPFEDIVIRVDGRCDGLLTREDGTIIIDEIKSTSHSLEEIMADSHPVHWAQAIFYGYIYAGDHDLNEVTIQLTYVQVKTEEQKKFQRDMTYEEMEAYVLDVIKQYGDYAKTRIKHQERRDRTSRELSFPFDEYRSGQRKLAGAVYKTILDKKDLFAKASTGIGKTISTIFPTIKAVGEGHVERVFYLTAKTITRTAAEDAFRLLINNGLDMNVVTITAKEKVCFQEEMNCSKEHCPFAEGYYDRINTAVLDILENEKLMSRAVIEAYATKHRVCPFEFSLDLAYAADAVICDYNYIFDPRVSLKRLFEEQKKQTVLLIDEAHNLVERAREMYSAELYKSNFLQIKREYSSKNQAIAKSAKAVNDHLLIVKKQEQLIQKELDEELIQLLEMFVLEVEVELVQNGDDNDLLLDTYFAAQAFVKISSLYDERFVTYVEVHKSEVKVKLFCLDPSLLIQKMGKGYRSKVFFSATLTPADYYKNLLGGSPEDYVISIPSPFMRENAEVIIQPLSTKYHDRERTMGAMVQFFIEIIEKRPGNFLVFFPSYSYMQAVYELFMEEFPHINTIIQEVGMSEIEREEFLQAFHSERDDRLVGFAVLGGIFSEGVDLVGDRLQGVIIVGVGLPQIGLERDIIKEYFQSIGRNGFDYAYVYPGMNKVLQAGGRLIRSENDKGVIALVDERFLQRKYQALLPYEWQHYTTGKQ
ncbi:ATP-dependent DNA helicase [Ornithinibacillus sp. L9]|uniref:ATP-dependent DNA helicase n=1 Tax=Ornithinibacillus caprae TaxID=2678566 RepID=A0A6N8FHA1_9BACI|nr:ATP-dependent DNA helicase [Ornithinibacillus caprae]MUK88601.1 ATP-dependent DNA helicase [Ornithinibacillus caprae]